MDANGDGELFPGEGVNGLGGGVGRSSEDFLILGAESSRLRLALGEGAALLEGSPSDFSTLRSEEVFLREAQVMDVFRTSTDLEGTGGLDGPTVGFPGREALLGVVFNSFAPVLCSSATALILRAAIKRDLAGSGETEDISGFRRSMTGLERMSNSFADMDSERTFSIEAFSLVSSAGEVACSVD